MKNHGTSKPVSFFPLPLPDELLDSAVYRYHHLSGNIHHRDTLLALFGRKVGKTPTLMTNNLDSLYERIPGGMFGSCNDMIDQLTLVPAFGVLYDKSKMQSVRFNSDRGLMFGKSGLYHSRVHVVHPELHCCPACAKEETERIGVAYWHRSHQLDGVVVCHIHGCDLLTQCPHCKRPVRSKNFMDMPGPICSGCNKSLPTVYSYPESVKELAVWAHEALTGIKRSSNLNWLAMEVLRRVEGKTEAFCTEALLRYGERYCSRGRNLYYSLLNDWLGDAVRPHVQYRCWGRWTLRIPSLTHLLVLAHSLFESWSDLYPPHPRYKEAA